MEAEKLDGSGGNLTPSFPGIGKPRGKSSVRRASGFEQFDTLLFNLYIKQTFFSTYPIDN